MMAAERRLCFQDAYVKVLAHLETLKRAHEIGVASEPLSNHRVPRRSRPAAEGDACNGASLPAAGEHEVSEKECIEDERTIHAKEYGRRERKKRRRNVLGDGDMAESNVPAVEQDRKRTKKGAARDGTFPEGDDPKEEIPSAPKSIVLENTRIEDIMPDADRKSRHSSKAELKKLESGQQRLREVVYKELKDVLAGYVKLNDLDTSDGQGYDEQSGNFLLQLGRQVREVVEALELEKTIASKLKESFDVKAEENEKLRLENEELHEKLNQVLSSIQRESLCKDCKTPLKADCKNQFSIHQTTEISADAGEEVAAEAIWSLSMIPNHRSIAHTSTQEKFKIASGGVARPLLGLHSKKADLPRSPRRDIVTRPAQTNPSSSRRKGSAPGRVVPEKVICDKTDSPCEMGREMTRRFRLPFRAETDQLTSTPPVKKSVESKKLGGDDFSDRDIETVIKRIIRTDARPWGNNKVVSKESIMERSQNDQVGDDTEKEPTSRAQSTGPDTSETTSARYMGRDEVNPVQEKDEESIELINEGVVHGKHSTEERGLEGEGEEKARLASGIYREYECGVSARSGDTTGILRVYESGVLQVYCQCAEATCAKGAPLTPWDFERHGGRGSSKKWRDSIWVKQATQRVPVSRVKDLDAYIHSRKDCKKQRISATEPGEGAKTHRDEFLNCVKCMKQRRFRRRNLQECLIYHDAAKNPHWECANYPDNKYPTCEEDEEREVRRAQRGCPRSRYCNGCIECVCMGCSACRITECECPSCMDFLVRTESQEPGQEVDAQTNLTKALNSPVSLPTATSKGQ